MWLSLDHADGLNISQVADVPGRHSPGMANPTVAL
jgi:hypothetical protein